MQKNAVQETALEDNTQKAGLVLRLIAIFWLLAKFISWKLWTNDRQFPLIPILDFVAWPSIVQYALFVLSIGLISLLIFRPFNKILLIALLCIELLSCAADQNRWQPWEYQYLFSIVICIINFNDHKKILACIAFTMASTYIYSGIGKLNEGYLAQVWENIFLRKIFKLSEASIQNSFIHYSGYSNAVFEIFFGIGLFFSKTKKVAAYGMIAMHLLLLYSLGPLGINYNTVIWPWNILMIILLYIIFLKNKPLQFTTPLLWQGWSKMTLLFWGILPALNYAGLWDSYLSSRLYSGKLPHMVFCLKSEEEIEELQAYLSKTDVFKLCNGQKMVTLQNWAMKEMNVPPYPEMRIYKKIAARWIDDHPGTATSFVYYAVVRAKQAQLIEDK